MGYLLSGIKNISYSTKDNEVSNGSEGLTLIECIDCVDAPEAIAEVLKWYTENLGFDFYDRVETFSKVFRSKSAF